MSDSKSKHAGLELVTFPKHIGLILDGNRRWARSQGMPTLEGHKKGYENLKVIAKEAFESGVEVVSAYIFSTENWNRSKEEVGYLMNLVVNLASNDLDELVKNNIKVVFIGSKENVPKNVIKAINQTVEKSKDKTGGVLALCFNYGGKLEIVDAVKNFAKTGGKLAEISEKDINDNLYHPEVPPIDLVIRTSGEQRLSNFMLWRISYSELYFVNKHWPEFSTVDLKEALADYATRQRRHGK